jgi:hypothetical protein
MFLGQQNGELNLTQDTLFVHQVVVIFLHRFILPDRKATYLRARGSRPPSAAKNAGAKVKLFG